MAHRGDGVRSTILQHGLANVTCLASERHDDAGHALAFKNRVDVTMVGV